MNTSAGSIVVVLLAGIVDPKWPVAPDAALAEPTGRPPGQRRLSPFDEAALEVALQLRDADAAMNFIALALAEPGDEAMLQSIAAFTPASTVAFGVARAERLDGAAFAERIAKAIEHHAPHAQLVLTGREFGDLDDGVVPVMLASVLDSDFVGLAQSVARGPDSTWLAVRPAGDGEARVGVARRAVVSITNAQRNRLRHPIVKNVMAARRIRFSIEALEAAATASRVEAIRSAAASGTSARDQRPHRVLAGALSDQVAVAARAITSWVEGDDEPADTRTASSRAAMAGASRICAVLPDRGIGGRADRQRFLAAAAATAESLATAFDVVVTGRDPVVAAADAAAAGARRVIAVRHALLDDEADARAHARVAAAALDAAGLTIGKHSIVLVPLDTQAEEIGHWFAAMRACVAVGRSTRLDAIDAASTTDRTVYGGRLSMTCRIEGACVASLRPAAAALLPVAEPVAVECIDSAVSIRPRHVESIEAQPARRIRLEGASTVVAGGRGIGHADGFELLARLAEKLGAALGGSLPAVDAGWAPVSHQIGQSGKYVSPDVYIAVGISGTLQHMAGIAPETRIVAINQDRDAAIFGVADIGIVGDWREIVPALTQALSSAAPITTARSS